MSWYMSQFCATKEAAVVLVNEEQSMPEWVKAGIKAIIKEMPEFDNTKILRVHSAGHVDKSGGGYETKVETIFLKSVQLRH